MADEPFAKRKKLDVDLTEVGANEVIRFRLLDPGSNAPDLMENASFAPEMAYKFFGNDEVRHAAPYYSQLYFDLKNSREPQAICHPDSAGCTYAC